MNLLIVIVTVLALATAVEILESEKFHFQQFMISFNKTYQDEEVLVRREIFVDNLRFINQHNMYGRENFTLAVNQFADMSADEFASQYLKKRPAEESNMLMEEVEFSQHLIDNAAESLDWRDSSVVSKVKDQAHCGSCWAFSTAGVVESVNAIKTGKLLSLSEQQLVDCDSHDDGCDGGIQGTAMKWVIRNGGLCEESAYPYKARDGRCKKSCSNVATISKSGRLKKNDEDQIVAALQAAPVSLSVDASGRWYQFYQKGIYSGRCGKTLDHAVLGVGYGTEDGQDYWTIKNSWGADWGEDGYFRLVRSGGETKGECGIAKESYVASV